MHTLPFAAYPLVELVALARARAPYYTRLYADLPEHPALHELPLVEPVAYWDAHAADRAAVLTAPLHDGYVFVSGGTTGAPKYSYYSRKEWQTVVALSVVAFNGTGLEDGERVGNLFVPGKLYSSFVLTTQTIQQTKGQVLQLPIGYFTPLPDAARYLRAFDVNALAGMPTLITSLIEHCENDGGAALNLRRILYAGEMFSDDQRAFLERRFPGIAIRSVGYASVDAGLIAYADADCGPGEHRLFDGATIVEIFDEETDEIIEEIGRPGRLIFTNLTRKLMPILRYPVGDRAAWSDPAGTPSRRFALLGRVGETARISIVTLPAAEVRAVLAPFREGLGITDFQMLVTREEMLDRLTLRLATEVPAEARQTAEKEILAAFERELPALGKLAAEGRARPTRVEWIRREELIVAERTGKLRLVVDRRGGE